MALFGVSLWQFIKLCGILLFFYLLSLFINLKVFFAIVWNVIETLIKYWSLLRLFRWRSRLNHFFQQSEKYLDQYLNLRVWLYASVFCTELHWRYPAWNNLLVCWFHYPHSKHYRWKNVTHEKSITRGY